MCLEKTDGATGPPIGKRVFKRASYACMKCQERKVRCDVAIRGSPCTNCLLDGDECEVRPPKRTGGRARSQYLEAQRRLVGESKVSTAGHGSKFDESDVGPGCSRHEPRGGSAGRPGGIRTIASPNSAASPRDIEGIEEEHQEANRVCDNKSDEFSRLVAATSEIRNHGELKTGTDYAVSRCSESHKRGQRGTQDRVLPLQADAVSSPYYIGYSYYGFLAVNNVSSMSAHDYRFLELQGCLLVPIHQILDVFVRQYFLHMHPMLPILEEGNFWDKYDNRHDVQELNSKIPLLLFQAMLFACCNFVPLNILNEIGLKTTRLARTTFYRRAKLLFDLEADSSSITKAQAALLLTSWSFSSYELPRKPNIPWLSIAIHHARDAEAHKYETFGLGSKDYTVRKRLWWCCIIRDRLFGLGMRRGAQIAPVQFDIIHSSRLGSYDLVEEVHRSKVHDVATKARLAEILELLVELCIILTDILDLAFPIEQSLKLSTDSLRVLRQIRNSQAALRKWYGEATTRLPNPAATSEHVKFHDSVILYVNLLYMYYYSTKVTIGHYEMLHVMATAVSSPANIVTIKDNHFELQNAALAITSCLEKLAYFRLIKWLPVTAVSCTALPLLLHVLGAEISSSIYGGDSNHVNTMKHRLHILQKAMETYQFQYEGIDWISEAINRVVNLARTGSGSPTGASRIGVNRRSPVKGEGWLGALMFQPGWYLRLAFTVDLALSKGRLPEDENFSRSFRELLLAKMGLSQHNSKQLLGETKSSDEALCAVRGRKDDRHTTVYAAESSGQAKIATEPSYVITEVTESDWEAHLFSDLEPAQVNRSIGGGSIGKSVSNTYDFEDIIMGGDENFVDEVDMSTLFRQEGLDGNRIFPIDFASST